MSKAPATAEIAESDFTVSLHPLVLITASDLITRHNLRDLEGPIAGILLGQLQGNVITAEHAFTAKLKDGLLDTSQDWTDTRIAQYKEVHQKPVLEVVGWFTLCSPEGPSPAQALLHKQLSSTYAENAILLAIHPQQFVGMSGTKAKLPISIYGSVPTSDSSMQVDGAATFRNVPFSIDTDETEMIAINYVAKGAGSAAAVTKETSNKSKDTSTSALSPEEEDQISAINTRLNSVKMLQERVDLMSKFVQSVPVDTSPTSEQMTHLRNVQALLTRLSLLDPSTVGSLAEASQSQHNDAQLQSVLSLLGQDIQSLSELGRKFNTSEQVRQSRMKGTGMGRYSGPGYDDAVML